MRVYGMLFSSTLTVALSLAPQLSAQTGRAAPEPPRTLPPQGVILRDTMPLNVSRALPGCPMPVARIGPHSGDSVMVMRVPNSRSVESATLRPLCINTLDPQRTGGPNLTDTVAVRRICLEPESVLAGNTECVLRDQSMIRPLLKEPPRPGRP